MNAPDTKPEAAGLTDVLVAHEMVGKSAPAGEHDCRLITKPHDGCGCTRVVVGCTGCDWTGEADGTQMDAHRAHVAAEVSRWLRAVLLGDEVVEAAARRLHPLTFMEGFDRAKARAALTAALDRVEALSTEETGT